MNDSIDRVQLTMLERILKSQIKRVFNWAQGYQNGSILAKASRFVACEMIEGDYFEFGVYQGATFINAHHSLRDHFRKRIALTVGGDNEQEGRELRKSIWKNMRFFAFDSFEGLPALTETDTYSKDFAKGQYACSLDDFNQRVTNAGIPMEKVIAVKGFFSETCNSTTFSANKLGKAAIIWMDADLYSSTKDILQFIPPLLQDGTVLIFDDWFSYKGSPYEGVQKAFREWEQLIQDQFVFSEYQRDSWKRVSFITTAVQRPLEKPRPRQPLNKPRI